jgi:hypothetical protein
VQITNFKDDDNFYRTTKLDLLLIGLVLFFSAFSILYVSANRIKEPSQPKVAILYQENAELMELDLQKDDVKPILDGKMQIEIKDGKIKVMDSDCPQSICVKMGWIEHSGQTIVCIPNHILIEIKSTGSQLLDAVSY